jgi:hypothetical protein
MFRQMVARGLAIAVAMAFGMVARGDLVTVDLSPYVNSDLSTYTDGWNYPPGGSSITVDGIPFVLASIGPSNDPGVIQTSGSSYDSYDIPIDLFGVTSADVLTNSAWGVCGTDVGEIDFVGSSGTYVYSLTEGDNIRDHFQGSFCNTAPGVTATANFGPDRLDLNEITLPAAFADETLESVDFIGYGEGQSGAPFLAGLTLDPEPMPSAPEPSTVVFLTCAMAAIVLKRRLQ